LNNNPNKYGQYAIRKVKISSNLKTKIQNNVGFSGCSNTQYSIMGFGESCNCTAFATRMWFLVTGEDYRPTALFLRAPLDTFDSIIQSNKNSGQFSNNNNLLYFFKNESVKIAKL
jgi:hypothetical protein